MLTEPEIIINSRKGPMNLINPTQYLSVGIGIMIPHDTEAEESISLQ